MKIKTWLLLSYLIVMILPLMTAYFLFAWIHSYNNEQKVEEHVQIQMELDDLKQILDDPKLYTSQTDRKKIKKYADQTKSITLYDQNGVIIYTSNPSFKSTRYGLSKEQLYQELYTLEQGYSSYSYKQPVFDNRKLIGFFDVQIARDEWVAGVTNRSYIVGGLFFVVFTLIYLTVILLVNKKFNLRLTGLMNDMTAFATGKDVHERQTKQDEIGKLTAHFFHMKHQIDTARKTIEQEQEAKEYLIASVSHDLKTPLTSIMAYAEALHTQKLTDQEQNEYRQVIMEKADFMQVMLDDLLTYTLLKSPSHTMELVEVEGSEFFEMLVSDYEALCINKGIELQADADVVGTYDLNPKQMIRVADNLVSNGIHYTKKAGHLWIAARSSEKMPPDWLFEFIPTNELLTKGAVYFIVQNEGKGIAKEKSAYVFEPLYQADEARSIQYKHGSGLGLSITKQIIEKHGGEVFLFSKENVGTCVICKLPKLK
ncbi:sensor histidine kinase [Virgibacillus alimentarius]|uniref:sensor histidine kinase n=1 Tax=Virgibacillus alimentarius TaxID=698769 RepID=UPI00049307E8|nr:HAMP domain-containing sensor histidine kinase [Virgibacillus alimentarius]